MSHRGSREQSKAFVRSSPKQVLHVLYVQGVWSMFASEVPWRGWQPVQARPRSQPSSLNDLPNWRLPHTQHVVIYKLCASERGDTRSHIIWLSYTNYHTLRHVLRRCAVLRTLTVAKLVHKFTAFYGTRMFITVFTTARHNPHPETTYIESAPFHACSFTANGTPISPGFSGQSLSQTVTLVCRWILVSPT